MPVWPVQSRMKEFYGDPVGANGRASSLWEAQNLIAIEPPFKLFFDSRPVAKVRVHKRCAGSLEAVFHDIWTKAGKDQSVIDRAGVSSYGGVYNFRLTRSGRNLSTHAFGAAIDLDPARNAFHDETPNFANEMWVVEAFEKEGWLWGGRWKGRSCDGMHFQAARTG